MAGEIEQKERMDTSLKLQNKVAVIGIGHWGKNLVRVFAGLGVLAAMCDRNADLLQKFSEQYPEADAVSDYSEILKRDDISAVILATPAEFHSEQARLAIVAGKDVYVEKPLCLSEDDGRELARLAKEYNCILMVGHLLWYHPAVLRLKELIKNGSLGRIQYIYSNRLNLGRLRREENVLWSFAPHDISVILGLTEEMPESVQAQGGNFLHQQIADTTVSLLNFKSGLRAHIFVSWLHPFKDQKLIVVGDKQMAVFDDTAPWEGKLVMYPHTIEWNGTVPVANRALGKAEVLKEEEPLQKECEHFLDCMETRHQPKTDVNEGLNVLKVLKACQKAMEEGELVILEGEKTSESTDKGYFHPTAVIDEGVVVGNGTKIWHFSHLLKGCRIGENCVLGQNVMIGFNVVIGNGCKIQNNVSVYQGVELEDYVFCGPSMVFTNVINPRSEFSRRDKFQSTKVCKGATLGANCTIICGVTIGRYAFVGAGTVVTVDVPEFALMVGNPAKQIGWVSKHGERLDLPLMGGGEALCPASGDRYRLDNTTITVSS